MFLLIYTSGKYSLVTENCFFLSLLTLYLADMTGKPFLRQCHLWVGGVITVHDTAVILKQLLTRHSTYILFPKVCQIQAANHFPAL
ncbi:hypothetical protein XENTR_v10005455 [Xenopus tropicalis]|nr:hypothetical protein XENTR_v10005455 [Xenopus tropicalis]